jgi:hypothetical protein
MSTFLGDQVKESSLVARTVSLRPRHFQPAGLLYDRVTLT